MPVRFRLLFFLVLLSPAFLFAQSGGYSTYRFLKLNGSARHAVLGGRVVSLKDQDLQLTIQNPALLDSNVSGQVMLTYVNYFADINYGYLAYARQVKNIGTFSLGLQSIGYGKFQMAEANADITGEFRAGEHALILQGGRPITENLHVGAGMKLVYSSFEQYSSAGTAFDAGVYYKNDYIATGLSIRDAGFQFKKYDQVREKLPFTIDAGFSGKLKKAPLRFTLNVSNLQRWNLNYDRDSIETNFTPVLGPDGKAKNNFITQTLSHLSGGVEVLLSKNFYLAGGYNYLRRQELKVPTRPGLSGFSLGFGLKVYRFRLSYAYTAYNPAGNSNVLTMVLRPSDFLTRK